MSGIYAMFARDPLAYEYGRRRRRKTVGLKRGNFVVRRNARRFRRRFNRRDNFGQA